MLLGGQRVLPERLQEAGDEFSDPEVGIALRKMLA